MEHSELACLLSPLPPPNSFGTDTSLCSLKIFKNSLSKNLSAFPLSKSVDCKFVARKHWEVGSLCITQKWLRESGYVCEGG